MSGEPCDMRRTQSQFQKESLELCQANPLLLERCYKLPRRCFMMVRYDWQLCSLKNKLDHVTLPLERRDKGKISSTICHWLEGVREVHMHSTRKLVHTRTITLHYCSIEMHIEKIFSQVSYSRRYFLLVWNLDPSFPVYFEGGFPTTFSPFPQVVK